MWTKRQIWRVTLIFAGVLLLLWTIVFAYEIGYSVLLISAPLAIFGFFANRMFAKTIKISREQAEQASRHVEELSHYIAEQERIGRILQKSEEKFRNAFDYAAIGMALISTRGRLLKVNRAFCEIAGFSNQELLEIDFRQMIDDKDLDSFNLNLSKLLDGDEQSCQSELRINNKKNELRRLMSSSSLVHDEQNKSSHFIFQFQDITDKKRAEEQLVHDALHDALTGLPNRVLFLDRLQFAFRRAKRRFDNNFAVLYMDFDRFKLVNDSYGHHVGDELLLKIAKRLKATLRTTDTVARLGGDEFTMLVEEISGIEEAKQVAERIREEMAKPFKLNGQDFVATVSIGIAVWSRDCLHPEFLMRDADTALYQAKRSGRNRFEVFDTEMHETALRFLQVETDLRCALERREFMLVYQPIVELSNRKLAGFEALIRWNHPKKGMISPMEFIPIAEETGLISGIGKWVLQTACRQLKEWQNKNSELADIWMSVNVSTKQFMEADLFSLVEKTLKETGIAPHCLKLEVTETAMVENIEFAVEAMNNLKRLGLKLAIDDFGTGYSSLNYLHRLPLSSLKIDRSFVNQMEDGGKNQEIIKTIVSLAKSLNLETIAEGIETISQSSQLENLSCQLGQGYYFAKPLSTTDVEKFFIEMDKPAEILEIAA
ncbi:MAG: putative bifunctional diguanylate cyclase/phosphodiesterase [Pyrinomonadaceae bacterium]